MDRIEDTDWQAIADQYQKENEKLRLEQFKMRNKRLINLPDISLNETISWIESHPMVVAILIYALSTLIMDVVEVYKRR